MYCSLCQKSCFELLPRKMLISAFTFEQDMVANSMLLLSFYNRLFFTRKISHSLSMIT